MALATAVAAALPAPMLLACSCLGPSVAASANAQPPAAQPPAAQPCCQRCVTEHEVAVELGCHCCDAPNGCDCDLCSCLTIQTPLTVPDNRRGPSLLEDLELGNATPVATPLQAFARTVETVRATPLPPIGLAGGPDAQALLGVWTL